MRGARARRFQRRSVLDGRIRRRHGVRDRECHGLHARPDRLGPERGLRTVVRARSQAVRLPHGADVDPTEARAGSRLQRSLLRRQPGGPRPGIERCDRCSSVDQRPEGVQAGCRGQHHELRPDRPGHPADCRAGGLSGQHRSSRPRSRTARSTASSWTWAPRSTCATLSSPALPRARSSASSARSCRPTRLALFSQKNSPLTPCVDQAIEAIKANGDAPGHLRPVDRDGPGHPVPAVVKLAP